MDLIDAKEFAQLQNEVATNDGTALPWTQAQIDALGEGTDWQSLVYQNALVQNHNLSFSGGGSNTKFYTSFGYFDQNGIILNSGFKRLSFRANIDQKINNKLNLLTTLSLQNSNYRQAVYRRGRRRRHPVYNHGNTTYSGSKRCSRKLHRIYRRFMGSNKPCRYLQGII